MVNATEKMEYKPYSYKKVSRVWFTTVWALTFEDDIIHKSLDFETIKFMCQYCNAAYRLGYVTGIYEGCKDRIEILNKIKEIYGI